MPTLVFRTDKITLAINVSETAWLLSLLRSAVLIELELTNEEEVINGLFLLLCACVSGLEWQCRVPFRRRAPGSHPRRLYPACNR